MSVPPDVLFIEADEPLLIFASSADARSCLEPVDVEGGVYSTAYGPQGQVYRLGCKGGHVTIERTGEEDRPEALKELLLRYFEGCKDPADEGEPLDVLVERAWSIECDYRDRCGSEDERRRFRMPLWGYVALIAIPAAILYFALR